MNEGRCSTTSWALSFEKLLNDEMGLRVFTEFLQKEFSQENIQFWVECEKFKALSDHNEVRSSASEGGQEPVLSLSFSLGLDRDEGKKIWSTYLHDTDDGSCRINIDSRTRQECQQALLGHAHEHMFEKAQSQIFQLMKYDSYARFLKSPMYKECIMNEMEGKSPPSSKPPVATNNEERASHFVSAVLNATSVSSMFSSQVKVKEQERKEKKRTPFLPWSKGKISHQCDEFPIPDEREMNAASSYTYLGQLLWINAPR